MGSHTSQSVNRLNFFFQVLGSSVSLLPLTPASYTVAQEICPSITHSQKFRVDRAINLGLTHPRDLSGAQMITAARVHGGLGLHRDRDGPDLCN
jgi:hypothetical protein